LSGLPLDELLQRSPGTPLGWLLLLKLVPGDGEQRFRLVPLAFTIGSVIVAGLFAHGIGWRKRWQARVAATLVGAAAALAPAALLRNDLKQYTADAFFALLILFYASRLDQRWTRSRLVTLILISIASAFFSYTSMFVSGAMLLGTMFVALRADRRQVLETLVGGAIAGMAFLAIAFWIVLPGLSPAMYDYWQQAYLGLGDGLYALAVDIWSRISEVISVAGFGGAFSGTVVGILGLTALFRLDRRRTAFGFLALLAVMFVLGVMDVYPFLNVRTSHFLIVTFVVIGAVGILYAVFELPIGTGGTTVALVVFTLALLLAGQPNWRAQSIPNEDVRAQVRYVDENREPGDVTVVNSAGRYGAAYYWQSEPYRIVDDEIRATGWITEFDGEDILIPFDRSEDTIESTLDEALTAAESGGKVWIVRTHVSSREREIWANAFAERSLVTSEVEVGSEALLFIDLDELTRHYRVGSLGGVRLFRSTGPSSTRTRSPCWTPTDERRTQVYPGRRPRGTPRREDHQDQGLRGVLRRP
jgi:hypothetical protein